MKPEVQRALGACLSDTLDQFGLGDPQARIAALLSAAYGEAAQAKMSLRQLVEYAVHVWNGTRAAISAAETHNQKKGN